MQKDSSETNTGIFYTSYTGEDIITIKDSIFNNIYIQTPDLLIDSYNLKLE